MQTFDVKNYLDTHYLLYYSMNDDAAVGCIGHLRGDFGKDGTEFYTTWWPHLDTLKTQEFKDELNIVVDAFRKNSFLKDLPHMKKYCSSREEAIIPKATLPNTYGFELFTEEHAYFIRCYTGTDDYNFYIYCYNKDRLKTSEIGADIL